ncbi:MAG: D-glycerate dehydrogenase [Firmicutes bacterium]|jgi:glyoxylate reductase|nr:D-glycerate dehydrogenase [Bacillota bacterium]
MRKPKVFVTCPIPEAGLDVLRGAVDMEVNMDDRVLTRQELLAGVADADGLLCQLADVVDESVLAAAPRLRAIANYAVGYNNIDIAAATDRRIAVTNTPGVLTETTADLTWALILAVARRVVEGDAMVRQGRFRGWAPRLLLGGDVYGRVLGVVGMGRIGQAVARRARGFGMKVLYYDRSGISSSLETELGATRVSLEELLRESDFVSLHVPLTPETRHLIGREQLAMMKRTAYLVNTARGPVVDEAALAQALAAGELAGAGLDVYENEPEVHPGLLGLDNVVLLPHLGSATVDTRERMAVMAAESLLDVLEGREPRAGNLVNRGVIGVFKNK